MHLNPEKSNTRTKVYNARTIGSFFLLAFLAYGFGRHFFESLIISEKIFGGLLIISNSAMVLFIGILLRRTLQEYSIPVARVYFFSRLLEAIALSSLVFNLIPGIHFPEDIGYFLAMLVLGSGSIPMCFILFKHKIIPGWLSIWGMAGYAIFAFGFLMELFGKEWSMYFLPPGGLWEVCFALWLIIKGGKK